MSNDFSRAAGLRDWAATEAELNGPGLFEVNGSDPDRKFITNVLRLAGNARNPGSRVIATATWLLAILGGGLLFVSASAQFHYVFDIKQQTAASLIEALSPDAAMVILSALGIGLALAGKASKGERFLIVAFAFLAAGMNYAAADPHEWRSVVAYTAPPLVLAVITDRVISVIRRHVLPTDTESAWSWLGKAAVACLRVAALLALYGLRAVLAPKSTLTGLRRMVLDVAPVPGQQAVRAPAGLPSEVDFAAHGITSPHLTVDGHGQLALCTSCPAPEGDQPPLFATKKEAFEWHYRRHPLFADREALSRVAREVGELAGLQWGTARTYASEILAADARAALAGTDPKEIAS